jgi:hypothetical protein
MNDSEAKAGTPSTSPGSRWSFLGLFCTFMQIELVSQIFLCTYRIEPKGSRGKELKLAFSARSHRWNLVHVLQDDETALCHDETRLNYRLIGALPSVIFVTIQIDARRDPPQTVVDEKLPFC